jgi:hypothetical protein
VIKAAMNQMPNELFPNRTESSATPHYDWAAPKTENRDPLQWNEKVIVRPDGGYIYTGIFERRKPDKPLVKVYTGDQPEFNDDDAKEYFKSQGRLTEYQNFISRFDDPEFVARFDNEAGFEGLSKSLLRNFFGDSNDIDIARNRYNRYVNEDLLSSLPPGPQSDTDIKIFSRPFPDKFTDAKMAKAYMQGLYKAEYMRSRFLEFQAEMRPRVRSGELTNTKVLQLWKEQYAKQAMAEISEMYPPVYGNQAPVTDPGEGYEIL